jgi:hypothetical protein
MANVLADLTVESEAATAVTFRLAGATDRAAAGDEQEAAFRRLALAATKYWVCKRAPAHAAEVLECFGGNGYVEESGLPRLYREAPLQSIWEGSGNVAALDTLRAPARQPESVEALFAEVDQAAGADRRLDAAIARLRAELSDPAQAEARARRLTEALAVVLQGSLLVRYGDPGRRRRVRRVPAGRRLGRGVRHTPGRGRHRHDHQARHARAPAVLTARAVVTRCAGPRSQHRPGRPYSAAPAGQPPQRGP